MMLLKQSTAVKIPFFMVDSTDSVTGKTGLSPTVTIAKDGAAFGSPVGSVTEIGNGWYYLSAATTGANDVGTLGSLLLHATASGADPWDECHQVVVDLPGASVSSVTGNVSGSVASVVAGVTLTAGAIQSIWDALTSALSTSGSVGKLLVDNINATISSRSTLTAANVWDALLSTISTATSIGKLIKDNLDVVLSTRLATSSYTAPDNASITAIKAKTDNLPAAPASTGDVTTVGTAVAAVSTKLGTPAGASVSADIAAVEANAVAIKAKTDNLPSNPAAQTLLDVAVSTRLASAGYTAPDNSGIAAIKAKTDNLPANPASQTNLDVAVSSRLAAADYTVPDNAGIADIQDRTDNLPDDPASESTVVGVGDQVTSVQSTCDAIKEKTDTIPTRPAAATWEYGTPIDNFTFPMQDSSGNPLSGLIVTAQRILDGQDPEPCDNEPEEIGEGWYKIALTEQDMSGDFIAFLFTADGALETKVSGQTEDIN